MGRKRFIQCLVALCRLGGLSVACFHWRKWDKRSVYCSCYCQKGWYLLWKLLTHIQQSPTPNVVLYHPAWWITVLSAMKTRQLCTQWWELDRVEWARTVLEEEEEGGQTKAASFLLLSVVGSDVWSSWRAYDSIICVWKWGWKLMVDILYIHICSDSVKP